MYRCSGGRKMLGEEERGKRWRRHYAVSPRVVGIRIEFRYLRKAVRFRGLQGQPRAVKRGVLDACTSAIRTRRFGIDGLGGEIPDSRVRRATCALG
jgi:hypothetical protein